MRNIVVLLALTVFLWLLLPATNASSDDSSNRVVYERDGMLLVKKDVDSGTFKTNLDPYLLELPIMPGRPAICIRNHKIGGH